MSQKKREILLPRIWGNTVGVPELVHIQRVRREGMFFSLGMEQGRILAMEERREGRPEEEFPHHHQDNLTRQESIRIPSYWGGMDVRGYSRS